MTEETTNQSRRRFITGMSGLGLLAAGGGVAEFMKPERAPAKPIKDAPGPHGKTLAARDAEDQAHAIQVMIETDNGKNLSAANREELRRAAGYGVPKSR